MKFVTTCLLATLAFSCVASAQTANASGGVIRSRTSVVTEDGGKKYHVEVKFSEPKSDGSSQVLPSMGVTQAIGSDAKAEQAINSGAIRVKLVTTSQPGAKTVHCLVSICRANEQATESDFTLTLP
jgi:hypothetical protein